MTFHALQLFGRLSFFRILRNSVTIYTAFTIDIIHKKLSQCTVEGPRDTLCQ